MPYPNPADIARMKEDKNITLLEQPGLNVGYLSFNTEKKPLDDVKVRQALTYAVNKEAIIKAVYQGAGQAAKNLIPPTMWGYNDDVKDYTYDPEKAKQLLKEAGLEKGFTIDLWAMPVQRPYNPNARRMAEMIQADWAKIGVQAKIVTYEWGEYLKRAKAGEHQSVMMGWTGDNGDRITSSRPCSAAPRRKTAPTTRAGAISRLKISFSRPALPTTTTSVLNCTNRLR